MPFARTVRKLLLYKVLGDSSGFSAFEMVCYYEMHSFHNEMVGNS